MSLLLILPREWDILAPRSVAEASDEATIMHAIDSDVFNYLCSKTDWASGRIGQHSALSYAGIAAALTEDIPRKATRRLRIVKRRCVRNSVERLVKAGLFLRQSVSSVDSHCLLLDRVFWRALLYADDFSTNADSRQVAGLIAQLSKNKLFNNNNLTKSSDSKKSDRYCADGIYNNFIYKIMPDSKNFRMTLTWQPEREFVDLFLQASGFSGEQIEKIWFGKYVQYWSAQPVLKTQREWSEHFANHMQSYLLRPGYFEKVNGMSDAV